MCYRYTNPLSVRHGYYYTQNYGKVKKNFCIFPKNFSMVEYRVSRYVDEGLKEHRQYFYRVCAVNQEGEKGPMSQEFSAFTREPLWQKET